MNNPMFKITGGHQGGNFLSSISAVGVQGLAQVGNAIAKPNIFNAT
jgi:hypothetical protein